jgi:3-phenylpropionate/trans-cinnamate dioxygenase ferredoxin subunit
VAKHIIASVAEIPEGQRKLVQINGREIAVFNVNGEYFAIHDKCPHEGASLCKGVMVGLVESTTPGEYRFSRSGELLRCPWHGWEFDIRTGKSWFDPKHTKVRSFEVAVKPGAELAEGPYILETFALSREDQYLIIDV